MESVTPPTPVASSASAASSVSAAASASDFPAGSAACPTGPARPAGGCGASRVELDNPPKPRVAFRVGIVGHRPNRLGWADVDALQKVLAAILQAAGQAAGKLPPEQAMLYDRADAPILRALSPLAEGVDRIFAEAALAEKWDLGCIMPFAQQEYEKDFAPPGAAPAAESSGGAAAAPSGVAAAAGSLEEFRGLLRRAADLKHDGSGLTRFELDGRRDDAGAAYGAAGRMVLNQSDLLVVVWDGFRLERVMHFHSN